MLILLFLAVLLSTTLSAPVAGVLTSDDPFILFGRELPPCMDIGSYRTKSNLIWSCLATIFACTWVAIHPNVPDQRCSEWHKFRIRVCTMIYALIGPEFVTMWALRQRIGAAKHVARYNQRFFPGLTPKSWVECIEDWFCEPQRTTDVPWSLLHGFLLEMHGLYLYNDEELRDGYELKDVDELDMLLEVPEKDINDKSKGDFLTKLIVVIQTTWFIAQCLARWATHLPVTELEVVTLAFAVLNIVTYIMWWNKPQSMHVPMRILSNHKVEFRRNWQELASASETVANDAKPLSRNPTPDELLARAVADDAQSLFSNNTPDGNAGLRERSVSRVDCAVLGPIRCITQWTTRTVNDLVAFGRMVVRGVCYCYFSAVKLLDNVAERNAVGRGVLAKGVILLVSLSLAPFMAMTGADGDVITEVLTEIEGAFYSTESGFDRFNIVVTTFIVSLVFGGLHLIPIWTVTFQSSVERHLWRICSFCIVVAPLWLVLTRFITIESRILRKCVEGVDMVSILSYMVARIILLAIAFATLRDLPQDAYRNIDWETLFPHL